MKCLFHKMWRLRWDLFRSRYIKGESNSIKCFKPLFGFDFYHVGLCSSVVFNRKISESILPIWFFSPVPLKTRKVKEETTGKFEQVLVLLSHTIYCTIIVVEFHKTDCSPISQKFYITKPTLDVYLQDFKLWSNYEAIPLYFLMDQMLI